MPKVELVMPKMGESIMEATILKWVKQVGDTVEEDETILEIATDKVDSEIPSPVDGVIKEILFKEEDVVEVGKLIAIIQTEGEEPAHSDNGQNDQSVEKEVKTEKPKPSGTQAKEVKPMAAPTPQSSPMPSSSQGTTRFYSPLVKSIAKKENIGMAELESINGSGAKGRVTKKDIIAYIAQRQNGSTQTKAPVIVSSPVQATKTNTTNFKTDGNVEIVEMGRMRKLIADHMVMSKQTSPHVTSFVEADVTNIVRWREKNKKPFIEKYGEKITYTPLFMDAVIKALKDFPMVNVSVKDNQIIVKKDLNIGMATALPSGNLIVPVIKMQII